MRGDTETGHRVVLFLTSEYLALATQITDKGAVEAG